MGKTLLKLLKGAGIGCFAVVLICAVAFYFGRMHLFASVSKAQIGALIEVRDACGGDIVKAYNLMLPHAPEGALGSMLGLYYPHGEIARDNWDAEAYALLLEAQNVAKEVLDPMREGINAGFVFHQDTYGDYWYVQLVTNVDSRFESISLIYCPQELERLGAWKALDDQPYWYYWVAQKV